LTTSHVSLLRDILAGLLIITINNIIIRSDMLVEPVIVKKTVKKKTKKKAIITKSLIETICNMDLMVGNEPLSDNAKNKHIAQLVGCSPTSVKRILIAWSEVNKISDWKVVLAKYKELNDEERLIRMYKNEGEEMSTNIITIERDVPIPAPIITKHGIRQKYAFLHNLQVGDSFEINGNMPDYTPKAVRTKAYDVCKEKGMKITIRTLEGTSEDPKKIRIWRVA
jgi:hypothetical protein